jgi:hypothetical protein
VRLILFLAGALILGAVGVSQGVIPLPTETAHAILTAGGEPVQAKAINDRPVEAYNKALPQILRGSRPDDQGFHRSALIIPPGVFRTMISSPVNSSPIGPSGFAPGAVSQVQQNNSRMQDMANYAGNPSAWHGVPPR